MALDGIAAVQARIQQIQQLVAGATPSTGSSAGGPAADTADFASLLAAASDGTNGSSSDGSGGLSTLTSLAGLTGANGTSGTGTTGALGNLASMLSAAGVSPTGTGTSSATAQAFLATAMSQRGKPYVWGSNASPTDPNPKSFDCSELTKWAAARVGVTLPDGASSQYLYAKDHGTTMTVDQALHTPGALLFHFNREPTSRANLDGDHVAISVGDGVHTMEARGHAYGTNVFTATGARAGHFNFAAMIPGM
jgi:cell wall-associated NlpC family hydrolase